MLFHYYFSRPSNFGRVAVLHRNTSISVDLYGLSRLVRLSFSFSLVSRRTNVRRLRLAPVREESAIGVAERSQVFKWLPCSFTSVRRPKCGWDPGRRDALLPEATAKARDGYVTTKRKTKLCRHLALRSCRERRVKVDDNALIFRVLYRARDDRRRVVVDILTKGGGGDVVMRCFRSRRYCLLQCRASCDLAARVPDRSWMCERFLPLRGIYIAHPCREM